MSRAFVLLATQRTGSSWVQEMLNSHPEVKVYSELFLSYASGFPLWKPNDVEFANTYLDARVRRPQVVTRPYWTVRYLQRVFRQSDATVVGFKYMYNQVGDNLTVPTYVSMQRVPVVHLIRRNLLDTIVSAKQAEQSGLYHKAADDRQPIPWAPSVREHSRIRLDGAEVIAQLQRLTRERRRARVWLRAMRVPVLEVTYEDLVAEPEHFLSIFDFLGVPRSQEWRPSSGLQKLNTEPIERTVENVGELRAALRGTSFASYLGDEVLPGG